MQLPSILRHAAFAALLAAFATGARAQSLTFVGVGQDGGDTLATLLVEAQPGGLVSVKMGPYVAPVPVPNDVRLVPPSGRLVLTLRLSRQVAQRLGHLPVQVDVYHGAGACTFHLDFVSAPGLAGWALRAEQICGTWNPAFAAVGPAPAGARTVAGDPPAPGLVGTPKQ